MADESESGCGPISGDELRRVKQLCRMRLAETTGGYGYTRPFAQRRGVVVSDCGGAHAARGGGVMQEEGYSPVFYVMLVLGIVGVIGFCAVAAGAAGGM